MGGLNAGLGKAANVVKKRSSTERKVTKAGRIGNKSPPKEGQDLSCEINAACSAMRSNSSS